ncbi:MAG: polysaccharide export protein [Puniceicoccaceae bacterium]|nr:polysaccharide export protein [Puniceicoccaceae bacterium]
MKQLSLFTALCFFFSTPLLQAQESGGESGSGGGSYSSGSAGSSSAGGGVGIVVGENYILKPSDVITVDVFQELDLNKSVRIQGDGSVALALIGKVKVAGMTAGEAQALITDLYNRDYLVDPQISLLVVEFSPKVIHILGSVNNPGVVPIPPDRDLTLIEAMASVRGVSRLGNPKSITIKRVEEDGRARQMEVNFSRIIQDPNSKDIILKEGDTIWVPERII